MTWQRVTHIKWINAAIKLVDSDTFHGTTPSLTVCKHFLGLLQVELTRAQKSPAIIAISCCRIAGQDEEKFTIAFDHLYRSSRQREGCPPRTILSEAPARPARDLGPYEYQKCKQKQVVKQRKRGTMCREGKEDSSRG